MGKLREQQNNEKKSMSQSWFFEKMINKFDKFLAKLTKRKEKVGAGGLCLYS
jgi:hypothetical protein